MGRKGKEYMKHLLLVEDQENILISLKTLLEFEGHQVFTAITKKAIEEHLRKHAIDLVLLDVYLRTDDGQQINGYEILDTIRRTPEWRDIRVLMTSGEDLREQAIEAGADGFLMKPYIPDKLVDSIQSHLDETAS